MLNLTCFYNNYVPMKSVIGCKTNILTFTILLLRTFVRLREDINCVLIGLLKLAKENNKMFDHYKFWENII